MKADVQAKKKSGASDRKAGNAQARQAKAAPAGTQRAKPAAKGAAAASASAGGDRRRIQVRRSGVHGKGVFALRAIGKGERLIEYVGEVITWPEALRRHPHDPAQPDHTFYFHVDDERVIDGNVGGNASRWINHACEPNLEAEDDEGRIFLVALHDIQPGEELFFDYGLVIDERYTPALKKRFECRCGSPACRGTMLAPKRARARKS